MDDGKQGWGLGTNREGSRQERADESKPCVGAAAVVTDHSTSILLHQCIGELIRGKGSEGHSAWRPKNECERVSLKFAPG